jgi:ABC-type proline/glycine betaine transport system permease subunit
LLLGVPYAVILAALLGVLCVLPRRYAGIVEVVAGLGLAVPWLAVIAFSTA